MKLQHGASRFEFAVTVVILGILASALLIRLGDVEAEAERLEVNLTVRNIRVGLQLAIGERIMRGEEGSIVEIARNSPIDFLGALPRGFSDGRTAEVSGQWAYDPVSRELSYKPRSARAFSDVTVLRWRYVARNDTSGRTVGASLIALN